MLQDKDNYTDTRKHVKDNIRTNKQAKASKDSVGTDQKTSISSLPKERGKAAQIRELYRNVRIGRRRGRRRLETEVSSKGAQASKEHSISSINMRARVTRSEARRMMAVHQLSGGSSPGLG